jgi:hypothetical protein
LRARNAERSRRVNLDLDPAGLDLRRTLRVFPFH